MMLVHSDQSRGFSLVELMAVIAVISLLLIVAYPSYQGYVKDNRRTEAQSALSGFAAAMERHFSNNNTYLGAGPSGADTGAPAIYPDEAPLDSQTKYYDLTIHAATISTYTLRATPKGTQVGDGFLELLSTTQRRWDKNDDGTIGVGEYDWQK